MRTLLTLLTLLTHFDDFDDVDDVDDVDDFGPKNLLDVGKIRENCHVCIVAGSGTKYVQWGDYLEVKVSSVSLVKARVHETYFKVSSMFSANYATACTNDAYGTYNPFVSCVLAATHFSFNDFLHCCGIFL